MSKQEVSKETEKVLSEHRMLREKIEDLKGFLEHPRPDVEEEGAHTWASNLAARLLELHGQLYRHFREEERSGFLEEIREASPAMDRAAENLKTDHDRLLSELRAILGAVMAYAECKRPENPNLRRWTETLLDELVHHEEQEMTLIQDLFYRDFGGPGPG